MRNSTLVVAAVIFLSSSGSGAFAQDPPKPQDPPQKPPVVAAEDVTKPTRGFFSALGHNLKDDVKTLLQIDTVDDVAHDPRAERCRGGDDNHCSYRCRIPTNMFFEILFEKSRQQLLVVWRQKRSDQGNILFSFGCTRGSPG